MMQLKRLLAYYKADLMRSVYHHGALYAGVAAIMLGLRYLAGLPVPLFWPLGVWFMVAAVHFFIVKSMSVDNDWADEKADRIRRDAYDFQHVREIYKEPKTLETVAREKRRKREEAQDGGE